MTLSPPVERERQHTRRYEFHGYRRADGLWDIEGRMTDEKTYPVPNQWRDEIAAGTPIHDMRVRLTVDDDFLVRDIEMATDAGPYRMCPDIVPGFAAIKGARVGPGWHRRLRELFGGVKGCTHQAEMLGAMGTVVFQTLWHTRASRQETGTRPPFIDSCHALASGSEVVKRFWPKFYSGS